VLSRCYVPFWFCRANITYCHAQRKFVRLHAKFYFSLCKKIRQMSNTGCLQARGSVDGFTWHF
jgi:hypothetical protein